MGTGRFAPRRRNGFVPGEAADIADIFEGGGYAIPVGPSPIYRSDRPSIRKISSLGVRLPIPTSRICDTIRERCAISSNRSLWSDRSDSNRRPLGPQPSALTKLRHDPQTSSPRGPTWDRTRGILLIRETLRPTELWARTQYHIRNTAASRREEFWGDGVL